MLAAIHAAAPRNARVFSLTLGMVGKNKKGRESTPALVSSRDNYFFISSFFISPFFISPFLDFLAAFLSPFFGWAPAWDAAKAAPLETANTVATRMEISFLMFSSS